MKKILYFIVSFFIIIFGSCVFAEIVFQLVPAFYKVLPENSKTAYVYVIGESSAYGYPYNISYSKIIRHIINNKINNKDIEIIMLAYPGDTLFDQYKKYIKYKYFHPFRKGIILSYIGTNDWCNFDSISKSGNFFSKFYLSNLLKNYFKNNHNFRDDYEKIIRSSKRFGDEMFVSTIAGNYAGFMPNDVSSFANMTLKKELKETDSLIACKKYGSALDKCMMMLSENNNKSQIWYRTGKIYENIGEIKKANEAYLNAVEYGWDARPTKCQNDVIKSLSLKYRLPLADIFNKLANSGEAIGYNFFDDKIHPSLNLNILIAENFVELLSKKYNVDVVNQNPSDREILSLYNFTDNDLFNIYINIFGEIFAYSFIDGNIDVYNLPKLRDYVLKIEQLNIRESVKDNYVNACNMIIYYLEGNREKVNDILYNKKLIHQLDKINIFCYKFRWDGKLIVDKINIKNKTA